ncbi:branched-chain-amino-acid aminotransferase, cytosolic isoform X2 [Scyliorhinus torazame]|uniref:branched-chain-amino-acid aminotransferase, cytosolic isoform X2 n=1 Tax=Scyliorhinus torazame TaxID=75743 RepID=UPI003B58DB1B
MENSKRGIDGSPPQPDTEGFKAADMEVELVQKSAEKPDPNQLVFGTVFSDHMLMIHWTSARGWERPQIKPMQNLSLHPAVSALHYAVELFEGLKAYRGMDNKIRLFRPMLNMERMLRSARRACLPSFDPKEMLDCIKKLVAVDREWVPYSKSASLYIRPVLIGTEPSLGVKITTKALLYVILSPVGPYFSTGSFSPVSLWADPRNYGASLSAQSEAVAAGCQQVLWLYGDEHYVTEAGTMNLFIYWINEHGEEELVTPPLDGVILPGVLRQSILDLARKWNQFKVEERSITMNKLVDAIKNNRIKEIFGSGTACVVCPIGRILYKGENLHIPTMENGPKLASQILENLTDMQYGKVASDWTQIVV